MPSARGAFAFYPGMLGLVSVGLLLVATFQAKQPQRVSAAWNFIAVAWLATLANVVNGSVAAFTVVSITSQDRAALAKIIEDEVYLAIVSAVTLPLFCTLPAIYVLSIRGQSPVDPMTRWVYGSVVIAGVDTFLFVLFVLRYLDSWGM